MQRLFTDALFKRNINVSLVTVTGVMKYQGTYCLPIKSLEVAIADQRVIFTEKRFEH